MCARVGHDVLELVRVRIGGLDLGDLAPGGPISLLRVGEEGFQLRPGPGVRVFFEEGPGYSAA